MDPKQRPTTDPYHSDSLTNNPFSILDQSAVIEETRMEMSESSEMAQDTSSFEDPNFPEKNDEHHINDSLNLLNRTENVLTKTQLNFKFQSDHSSTSGKSLYSSFQVGKLADHADRDDDMECGIHADMADHQTVVNTGLPSQKPQQNPNTCLVLLRPATESPLLRMLPHGHF
ncbi:hypothetical protein Salat_0864200 [Sesamum alatum]|uniref:Uncharacterized protein n=1 Tax=Sesamum alatum TaxID=300844 RepID=A0AAE1YJ44_9LAMI|nr:hypothetical protein Salat_0864200 [Sesamum alatum]